MLPRMGDSVTRLTKRIVDGATPADKDYFIWDDDLSGFGLRVMRSGRRSYVIQYRSGGRTRRLTFAKHGVMTPDEARKMARELLVDVAKGGILLRRNALRVKRRPLRSCVTGFCRSMLKRDARRPP